MNARANLQLRLLTAAIGLPLVTVCILAGGWLFATATAIVALLATAEFVHGWLFPSRPISAVAPNATTFGVVAVVVGGVHADTRFLVLGAGFAAACAVAGYSRSNRVGPRKPWRVLSWAMVYVGGPLAAFVLLRDANEGRDWAFLAILATFAVDTGAYATGKLFGRHKMAPAISPGKTWEGAAGGYVAGVIAVFALNAALNTGVPAAVVAPAAIGLPLAAQAGDLFESWMKRRMGVKDASGLLPGHGGFLDRLDSLTAVVPLLYLYLRLRVL